MGAVGTELSRDDMSSEAIASPRIPRAYAAAFAVNTLLILFVFAEPTLRRLALGVWQRGRFPYTWTLSLDVHAVAGFAFLFAIVAQAKLGARMAKHRRLRRTHRRLGRLLILGLVPVFLAITAWAIFDRSTTIPPEKSNIFITARPFMRGALAILILLIGGHAARAYLTIRRGDVRAHLDAILTLYLVAGGIALIRLLYFIAWMIWSRSPLSVPSMFFLTVALMTGVFVLTFALAGRLRENLWGIAIFLALVIVLAVTGADQLVLMNPLR
jgi:hypothetical protein